jgi:hypothetical protein
MIILKIIILKISMREQELAQLEKQVRDLEQTNLGINEKLDAAHLADANTFTYYIKLF